MDELLDRVPVDVVFQMLDLKNERDRALERVEVLEGSLERHHEALRAVQECLAEYYHENEELQTRLARVEAQLKATQTGVE